MPTEGKPARDYFDVEPAGKTHHQVGRAIRRTGISNVYFRKRHELVILPAQRLQQLR